MDRGRSVSGAMPSKLHPTNIKVSYNNPCYYCNKPCDCGDDHYKSCGGCSQCEEEYDGCC